jgi:ligand-binding SRPBCC domain-containing protein
MDFRQSFDVHAPLSGVQDFHARSVSLQALTPRFMPMQLLDAPPRLQSGDTVTFRMWLGPLPILWTARIENSGPRGFTDMQLKGPFAAWVHRHSFEPGGRSTTRVEDSIQARLRPHAFWAPLGLVVWMGLSLLFAFRRWKTRRMLGHP